jgi:hypothetical protein
VVYGLKHQKEKRSMDHFAGLDVSVKETSVCIVDDTGRIVREVKVMSEPEALLQVLGNPIYRFKRIGLEAGPLSQWLFSALAEVGLPAICVETRHMRAVLSAQINKTDRNDARGMARMMRAGLYRPVHVKTLRSQKLRMLLTHRKLLQSKAIAIENDLRGTLRNFGLGMDARRSPHRPASIRTTMSRVPPPKDDWSNSSASVAAAMEDSFNHDWRSKTAICGKPWETFTRRRWSSLGRSGLTCLSIWSMTLSSAQLTTMTSGPGRSVDGTSWSTVTRERRLLARFTMAARSWLVSCAQAINNNDCANSCIRQTLNDVLHGDGADLGFNSLKDQVAEARRTLFFLFRRWTERFVNETRLAVPWPSEHARNAPRRGNQRQKLIPDIVETLVRNPTDGIVTTRPVRPIADEARLCLFE